MDEAQHDLNAEGRDLWDSKAAFWDDLHGDAGNIFHRLLLSPAVEHLLNVQAGERVIDIACGNGVMSRRLAELGATVVGVDFSAALIERATARGQASGTPIDYHVVDATDEDALAAQGEGTFDAVVTTMALMDMPVIAPLFRAAKRLLKPEGRLVFATAHPAFNSNTPTFFEELADVDGEFVTTRGVKLSGYLDIPPVKGLGAPGEPNPHYYYHRPLSQLLGEAFAAGFVLDGIEERAFPPETTETRGRLSWRMLSQFPPLLAGRLRAR